MDWGSANVLAVALSDAVYLWNVANSTASELVTVDEEDGPVTSVSWAPDGRHLAIGLENSLVQIWDVTAIQQVRTLRWGIRSQVNAPAWNNNVLTTGDMDGKIINNDVRVREHVETYRDTSKGHAGQNDQLQASYFKALSWCPFQGNLLASGGGVADKCIKFWNTETGTCLKSVDTGSQVCALLWSKHKHELLSSHGLTQNQLTLWKYPSMVNMAELLAIYLEFFSWIRYATCLIQ